MELSDIDWSTVRACYGLADNIPPLLAALRDPAQSDGAVTELWGHLCHQGTVYEASAVAVPFLLEAALDQALGRAERDLICGLIVHIGLGKDTCWKGYTTWDIVERCSDAVAKTLVPMLDRAFAGDEAVRPWAIALATYHPSIARDAGRDVSALLRRGSAVERLARLAVSEIEPAPADIAAAIAGDDDLRDFYEEVISEVPLADQARQLVLECAASERL